MTSGLVAHDNTGVADHNHMLMEYTSRACIWVSCESSRSFSQIDNQPSLKVPVPMQVSAVLQYHRMGPRARHQTFPPGSHGTPDPGREGAQRGYAHPSCDNIQMPNTSVSTKHSRVIYFSDGQFSNPRSMAARIRISMECSEVNEWMNAYAKEV